MKRLYLLRHAKSSWKNPGQDDFDRPLNERGERAGALMATFLEEQGFIPRFVFCSASARTRQTLERISPSWISLAKVDFRRDLYLASPKTMMKVLSALPDDADNVMIIAHNPGSEEFASYLAGDGDAKQMADMAHKFPTAALAVFDLRLESWKNIPQGCGKLVRFAKPRDLETTSSA